jgi:hypothetical protein
MVGHVFIRREFALAREDVNYQLLLLVTCSQMLFEYKTHGLENI